MSVEDRDATVNELIDQFHRMAEWMTDEQKQKLRAALGTQINIFFCGSAAVNSGISFQVNGDSRSALDNIPPEAIAEILKAIASVISRRGV